MRRIGIIGGGRFGAGLAQSLAERGIEVLLLDRDRGAVERLAGIVAKAMEGDATEEGTLEASGFNDCDVAVVAIASDLESSVLATLTLKEMKIPCIIAKAANDMHGKVLGRLGADRVIYPNKDSAARLARTLTAPSVLDYVEVTEGVSILEIAAPMAFVGKTLAESKVRQTYGVTVLVLRRAPPAGGGKPETVVSPNADDTIELGDTLVIFGKDEKLHQLSQELSD